MAIGLLVLRVIVGLLFVGHGTQKLFGWFGGHGPEGTATFLGSLGYRPSRRMALVAGVTETLAGAMLALGFLTPVASAAIIGVMVNATVAMHLRNGLWNSNGGYELPLVYATVAAGLAFAGPGRWSVDRLIGFAPEPVLAGVGAIALGVVAGVIALATREREMAPASLGRTESAREAESARAA
jgi:putative oxidoreductase